MSLQKGRYSAAGAPSLAEGWTFDKLTPPSRLFGANGLRTGPDGRIYVAQVVGSQISALDVDTGELETISAKGGDIVGPDDVAFGPDGTLFATEVMDARVSARAPNGQTRVLRDDLPNANGITVYQGRLFVNECRVGGRLLELDLNGGQPRVLAENLPMPNAMEVGPDGMLYYPLMGTQEIWRIHPDGGTPERVVGELGVPDAVKFDSKGFIVSTQVATGEVLRIDPRTGERSVLANLAPGLDNLALLNERVYVSNFTGEITEIQPNGQTRTVLPGGFSWPLDLEVGPDGRLYVADGTYFYAMSTDGSERQTLGMLMSPGYPSVVRGVVWVGPGEFVVTTANGQVSRYRPEKFESEVLADGFDQPYGLAAAPSGAFVAAEFGGGRVVSVRSAGEYDVLATGLKQPTGVAFTPDGSCLVSESGAGRVVKVTGSGVETVVDSLECPQGILVQDGKLFIVDAGSKKLVCADLARNQVETVVSGLPVGAPPGVTPKPLRGMPPFSGPQGPFAGIAAGPDGTLYVSCDADGSVAALRKQS